MLVNCNSCQKKFEVPDSAITEAGRLLQCGSCGNKWTQYPIKKDPFKNEIPKKEKTKFIPNKIKKIPKIKNSLKKKKREISLYSQEYLRKKHGLEIKDNLNTKKEKKINSSTGFFSYFITITIFIIATFGILNLTKELIILNYPQTELYFISFYEVVEVLKITVLNLIN